MKPETKSTRIAMLEAEIARLQQELAPLKPEHSGGPWKSELEDEYWKVRDPYRRTLCYIEYDYETRETDSANFHLFALSERMHRFLADLETVLEYENEGQLTDELKELRKILALAKGEEP